MPGRKPNFSNIVTAQEIADTALEFIDAAANPARPFSKVAARRAFAVAKRGLDQMPVQEIAAVAALAILRTTAQRDSQLARETIRELWDDALRDWLRVSPASPARDALAGFSCQATEPLAAAALPAPSRAASASPRAEARSVELAFT